jgi:hypothetical protein
MDLTEAQLDALAGRLFAEEDGKLWLALMQDAYPLMVATERERVRRMRVRWGDRSSD